MGTNERLVNKWFKIGMAIGMHRSSKSVREIGLELQVPKSTVGRWVNKYNAGTLRYVKRASRLKTSARSNRLLVRIAKVNRSSSASHLKELWGERIGLSTVYRRLRKLKLRPYRKVLKPFLTEANKASRLTWSMQHCLWREPQWNRVVFTDESRFTLHRNDGRLRIWRERGERFKKEFIGHTKTGGGGSVHVWAAIWHNGKSILIILNESVTAVRYRATLENFIATNQLPPNFILQDDNAPPHRGAVVREWKETTGIRSLQWPPCFPDLNPIEHAWDYLG
jgi:transposase